SESESSHQKATEDSSPSRSRVVRTPTSAPRCFTSSGIGATIEPSAGLRNVTGPRASVEWKPSPKFKKSSVCSNGPSTKPNLGLPSVALLEPLFQGPVQIGTPFSSWGAERGSCKLP